MATIRLFSVVSIVDIVVGDCVLDDSLSNLTLTECVCVKLVFGGYRNRTEPYKCETSPRPAPNVGLCATASAQTTDRRVPETFARLFSIIEQAAFRRVTIARRVRTIGGPSRIRPAFPERSLSVFVREPSGGFCLQDVFRRQ